MTWRRGEVWLESEMLWFREAVAAPAFAGIGPAAIPSLAHYLSTYSHGTDARILSLIHISEPTRP